VSATEAVWMAQRARFPVLSRHAYLNAGTFGPLARETVAATDELRAWEAEHGRGGRAYFDAMLARRERVRALLAAQIGVPADRVALTDSTTQSVQVVVVGLGLEPSDEVVTTDVEHFGLVGPLVASPARVRVARVRGLPPEQLFEAIRAEVTPRTRLLALSHVSWIDGVVVPWQELARATGVPVLVDGAQGAGAIAVDATAADFYTVSAQKWLCGPDGTGALYVREPDALPIRLAAYASQAAYDIAAGTFEPKPGAARFDPSFTPAATLAGLEAALTGLPDGRFERSHALADRCREALRDAGYEVVGGDDRSPLVSFRVTGDAAVHAARLYADGVIVRDLPGSDLVRASVGWWNDESDIARLVTALAR
jgi:L-cysteine/cystine lyase